MYKLPVQYKAILTIGDMHIHKDECEEGMRIITWVTEQAWAYAARTGNMPLIALMGDQHNDFAIMHVVVHDFWVKAYAFMKEKMNGHQPLSLIGNHDMNQEETASAMAAMANSYNVAREPVFINATTAAVGFMRNEELFYQQVMSAYIAGARTIYCHAEFDGSQYENGFFAPHGFDLSKFPSDLNFISGHIHLKQEFGKVFYVGTPRHLTRSDIGEVKGIHIFDESGCQFIPTPPEVSEPFQSVVIDESKPETQQIQLADSNKIYVEIKGTHEFCKKIERQLPGSVRAHSTYTDEGKAVDLKESEGIPVTFSKFSDKFFETNNIPDHMRAEILKKVYDTVPMLRGGTK